VIIYASSNKIYTRQTIAMSDDRNNKTEDSKDNPINAEETNKKAAIGKVFKIVSVIMWSIVILLVLIPLLGRLIMSNALAAELTSSPSIESTQPLVAFAGKEMAFRKALNTAHQNAEHYAKNELDLWEEELINRIDTDFLNWYFNYFNQKKAEINIFLQYVGENVMNGFDQRIVNDNIATKINNDIQREFARRVLQAESAEMKLNTIAIDTAEFYIKEVSKEFDNVPKMYKIPLSDWNKYLEGINMRLKNERGNQVLIVTIIGGAQVAKITVGLATKAGAKAVGTIYAQLGSMIEPTVTLALIAWDYLDYTNGVKENKPRLRKDLINYLDALKKSLLSDPEHGVMSVIDDLEQKIKYSVLQGKFAA
jgi:hypothetical protein